MTPPDYSHSLLNLVASVGQALGGPERHVPLAELPVAALQGRPVLLWVIDGLGNALLERFPQSWLAQQRTAVIDSVFPTTTASAMSSYYTGASPAEHAVTGWFMWLRELGSLATILPFRPRHGGHPYSEAGVSPGQLIGAGPLSDRLAVGSRLFSPAYIVDSDFSRALAGRAERQGVESLAGLGEGLLNECEETQPRLLFAYWSELDALAHRFGCHSAEVEAHFHELDALAQQLAAACRTNGTALLISADHGLIDSSAEHRIELADHPTLQAHLALPLCGEPRTAYAYLRPGHEQAFRRELHERFGEVCEVVESAQLIAEGWFGPGRADPRLEQRVGDLTLLMKENWVISERLPFERSFNLRGVHGGLSKAELKIPLVAVL